MRVIEDTGIDGFELKVERGWIEEELVVEVSVFFLVVVVIKYFNKYNIYFSKGLLVCLSDRFVFMSCFSLINVWIFVM